MLKFVKLLLPLALAASVSAHAVEYAHTNCVTRNDISNLMTDVIFVRPVGAVGTLAGGALFLGLTPFTALASMIPPHDAFQKVGSVLVGVPYSYTFARPLGDFSGSCF